MLRAGRFWRRLFGFRTTSVILKSFKLMESTFYFPSNGLFVFEIYLFWIFEHVKRRLDMRAKPRVYGVKGCVADNFGGRVTRVLWGVGVVRQCFGVIRRLALCGLWGPCGLCIRSRARREPRLPRLILMVSFSDTLLVVSILDMSAICDSFCSPKVAALKGLIV